MFLASAPLPLRDGGPRDKRDLLGHEAPRKRGTGSPEGRGAATGRLEGPRDLGVRDADAGARGAETPDPGRITPGTDRTPSDATSPDSIALVADTPEGHERAPAGGSGGRPDRAGRSARVAPGGSLPASRPSRPSHPAPLASLRPRAASVSRRFAPPRPGRSTSAEVHFGRPAPVLSLAASAARGRAFRLRGRRGRPCGPTELGPSPPAGVRSARPTEAQLPLHGRASSCRPVTRAARPGAAEPLRVPGSGLGVPAQPPRRASLQKRRLPARRSMPWQCGRSAALRSSRAGLGPARGHLRARSLPPGRTSTRSVTTATTSVTETTRATRTRPTRAAAKERKGSSLRVVPR